MDLNISDENNVIMSETLLEPSHSICMIVVDLVHFQNLHTRLVLGPNVHCTLLNA